MNLNNEEQLELLFEKKFQALKKEVQKNNIKIRFQIQDVILKTKLRNKSSFLESSKSVFSGKNSHYFIPAFAVLILSVGFIVFNNIMHEKLPENNLTKNNLAISSRQPVIEKKENNTENRFQIATNSLKDRPKISNENKIIQKLKENKPMSDSVYTRSVSPEELLSDDSEKKDASMQNASGALSETSAEPNTMELASKKAKTDNTYENLQKKKAIQLWKDLEKDPANKNIVKKLKNILTELKDKEGLEKLKSFE